MRFKITAKLLDIILIISTVLISRTVYLGIKYHDITLIFYLFLAFFGLLIKKYYIRKSVFKIFGIFVVVSTVSAISRGFTGDSPSFIDLFKVECVLFVVAIIVSNIKLSFIATWYVRTITAMAAISLPCYYIANTMPEVAQRFYIIDGTFLLSPYYTWGWISEFNTMFRNSGIFWEPGAFQAFIVLALLMILFAKNDLKKPKVSFVVLFITLLTTESTTGYIVILIMIVFFWNDILKLFGQINSKLSIFIRTVMFIGFLFAFNFIMQSDIISSKLTYDNYSFQIRSGDLINSISLIKDRFLFGYGIGETKRAAEQVYGILNNSNGLLAMMYTYGLIFSTMYIVLYIKGTLRFFCMKTIYKKIGIILIMVILHCTEGLWWLATFMIFICSSIKERRSIDE